MAIQSTPVVFESLLRAQEIREMIRDAHGAFAPDHVARYLRDRYMEPIEKDAQEIADLLVELIAAALQRIEEEDIEPLRDEKEQPPKLTRRERESVSNLAMLMATRSMALVVSGAREEALELCCEGLAWSRTAGDHMQQSLIWTALYVIFERLGRSEEKQSALIAAVETARASGSHVRIVEAIIQLIGNLIDLQRLDEAEQLIEETLSILQNDLPEEKRHPYYAQMLGDAARIARYRGRDAESIQGFREALRWADGELFPMTRCSLMTHLGMNYLRLGQYQQCIECQHEVVKLADAMGTEMIKSWGYLHLADVHIELKEYDEAMEFLDQAEGCSSAGPRQLHVDIILKRAGVLLATEHLEEAAALCREVIEHTVGDAQPVRTHRALRMLGEVEMKCSRYESAEEYYRRAVTLARQRFPQHLSPAQVDLASLLHVLGRYDEAVALLDECILTTELHPPTQAMILRLHASIAEARGDLRAVIDYERRAVTIEQELLERRAEQSLRNARIMAQTDLLEREAELERERRRRLERELATAVVALGDHKRQAAAVEERLRTVLTTNSSNTERAVTTALREALVSLRNGRGSQETVHHYLAKVDEDFQHRLRQRYPNLTRKQERLCGLIRTGLDSKEIGSLLGLEPEGLKALRKRLRKALGLDQEVSLETFLADI